MSELENISFVPSKQFNVEYTCRNIERRVQGYGSLVNFPATYTLMELFLANRASVLTWQDSLCEEQVRATYMRFIGGHETGSDINLKHTMSEIGQDKLRVNELADSLILKNAYLYQA